MPSLNRNISLRFFSHSSLCLFVSFLPPCSLPPCPLLFDLSSPFLLIASLFLVLFFSASSFPCLEKSFSWCSVSLHWKLSPLAAWVLEFSSVSLFLGLCSSGQRSVGSTLLVWWSQLQVLWWPLTRLRPWLHNFCISCFISLVVSPASHAPSYSCSGYMCPHWNVSPPQCLIN